MKTFPHKEVASKFGIPWNRFGYNKFGEAVVFDNQYGWINVINRGPDWIRLKQ